MAYINGIKRNVDTTRLCINHQGNKYETIVLTKKKVV
jgi:hypothetical protein